MTIRQTTNRIDSWFAGIQPDFIAAQNTYFTANGEYFQGLLTHTARITQDETGTGDRTANNLASSPTDRPHDYRDFIGTRLNTESFPAVVKFDVYDGPRGKGWTAVLLITYAGKDYERHEQSGPETHRTQGWREVEQVV